MPITRKGSKLKKIYLWLLPLIIPNILFANEPTKFKYEIESLFPMYFYDGYHLAVGIRINDFRYRISCIDGGDYNYEPNNDQFERNLGRGCGVFAGYFLDSHWHIYLFLEKQYYTVTKRDSNVSENFDVIDVGPGIGYQYFFSKKIYIQPAIHLYWRNSENKSIDGSDYVLREYDVSPVVRVGYQF